jgi:hypothetical protein
MAKVEMSSRGVINIDLKKERKSGTAANQFVKEPNTEVYYGRIHARVTMFDIGIAVEMDPYKGDWKDGAWAREQALNALKENLTPEILQKMLQVYAKAAKKAGRNEMRKSIKELMAHEY